MPLVEELPSHLATPLLKELRRGDLVAVISADLDRTSRFSEEWLVLTERDLQVWARNGHGSDAQRGFTIELDRIKQAANEPLVGGGTFRVQADGQTLDVLRYTHAQQNKFSRVAKFLNDRRKYREALKKGEAKGEPPVLVPDEDEQKRCPSCKLHLPKDSKVCPACLSKGKVLKRLMKYVRPHWKSVAAIWVLMLVGLGLSLIPPYLTRPLMDLVLAPQGVVLPEAERVALLGLLVLAMLAVQLAGNVIGIFRGREAVALGTRMSHEMRADLFGHLQRLSMKFFDKRQTGSLMARVTRDTQSLENVLVDGVQHFLSNILLFLGIGCVLLWMNWKLTLLALVPAPLVLILSGMFYRRLITRWRACWHLHARMSALVNDTLSGMRIVRAFAKEDREIGRFGERSADVYRAERDADQLRMTAFPLLFFVMHTGTIIVWYFGGRGVLGGDFTLGTLIAFNAYLLMFFGPLQWMSHIADYLSRSLAAAERVFEILDTDPEVRDLDDARALPALKGAVEFRRVTFGYEKHKPVIKEMSFTVAPGEMIGLVGKSGAGKSTTINLLCRFYDPQEGEILIDGVPLKKLRQQDLRSQVGMVLQDTFLFSGTIAENIAYGKPDATREEIMAAAKAANAHDFICQRPDGYDSQVGERGQALSAGERQRVSIARAILHNPRILILDEATSSVDTETEKQIQEAIARLIRNRTTFAIAHRLSTLRNAHRLLVLREGEIAESGTHEELMEKKGEFHKLVAMQQDMSRIIEVGG